MKKDEPIHRVHRKLIKYHIQSGDNDNVVSPLGIGNREVTEGRGPSLAKGANLSAIRYLVTPFEPLDVPVRSPLSLPRCRNHQPKSCAV